MRLIDGDALKESLEESRDNCILWLQDCKEAKSQKWIGRAEQALMTFNECLMRIDTIPTIESEQKTGKWIPWKAYYGKDRKSWSDELKCSECGFKWGDEEYKFCPMCGVKMEGQDETD